MKSILLPFLFIFISIHSKSQCIPTVSLAGSTGDFIDNFTFGSLTNLNSGDHPCDYSLDSATGNFMPGMSYPFSIQIGSTVFSQNVAIWIDFNNNQSFLDPGEFIFNSATPATSSTPVTGTITIPPTLFPGQARMRVCCKANSVITSSESCGISTFGEYEDYNINISPVSVCSGVPNAGNTQLICCSSSTGIMVSAYLQGASNESGLVYQWQRSNIGSVGPWVILTGVNNSILNTTSPSASACYRCIVICSASGLSDTSIVACLPCSSIPLNATNFKSTPIEILAYPNPAESAVNVFIPLSINTKVSLTLYNLIGEQISVWDKSLDSKQEVALNLNHIAKGTYVLKIEVAGEKFVRKLVRE